MTSPPLTVFLIAYNEADRLARTLEAARALTPHLILVDGGSSDETVAIAEAHGARVIVNAPFPGYGAQKRLAEDACETDWVLNIDADEVIQEALADEVRALFERPDALADGYSVEIVEMLPGDTRPSRWASRVRPVRLYRRSRGRYSASTVHDRVTMAPDARIGALRAPLWHFSIRSLPRQMLKHARYVMMQAEDFRARGRRLPTIRLLTEFPLSFLRAYLMNGFVFRGLYGFAVAMNYASYRFLRVSAIYELQSGRVSRHAPAPRE